MRPESLFSYKISWFIIPLKAVAIALFYSNLLLGWESDPLPEEGLLQSWTERDYASGNWNGVRSSLEESGVLIDLSYTGEVFSNLRGGLDTSNATRYRGSVDLIVALDTERLGFWQGGSFFIYGLSQHGSGISERYVGDIQSVSNNDAHDFTQVNELWFEQNLLGDWLRLKIGKQDPSGDFCASDFGGDFINQAFTVPINIPMLNSPDTGLGASAFVEPLEWLTLSGGIFDGDAKAGTSGFSTTFDGEGGAFSVVQADIELFGDPGGGLPGTWRIGAWHHSDSFDEITLPPTTRQYSDNHGAYMVADQVLYEERVGTDDFQGLGAFLQLNWAPENRNEVSCYTGGGFSYTGLLPGRDLDVTAVGVARALFSRLVRDLDGRTHETAIELFHRFQATPWLSLQPEFQFIFNPGGDGRNAVVAGMRFEITF